MSRFIRRITSQTQAFFSPTPDWDGKGLVVLWQYMIGLIRNHFFHAWCVFALSTVFFTWPTATTFSTTLIGDGGDNYGFAISQHIVAQNLGKLEYPYAHTDIYRYPYGFNFGIGADAALMTTLGAVLQPFLGVAVAYNSTVYLTFILNACAAYALAKHLSKSHLVGILGGILFAFSGYVTARASGHLNLMLIAGFPLLWLAILQWFETKKKKYIFAAGLAVNLIAAGSVQYLLLLLAASPILVAGSLIAYFSSVKEMFFQALKSAHVFIASLMLSVGVLLLHSFPYISALLHGNFQWRMDERTVILDKYNTSLLDLIRPNTALPTHFASFVQNNWPTTQSIEHASVYLGISTIIGLGLFFLNKKTTKSERLASITVIVGCLALLLGKNEFNLPLPYTWLFQIFPFSGVLETGRYVVLLLTLSIGAMALGFKRLTHPVLKRSLLALLTLVMVLERWPSSFSVSDSKFEPYTQVIRQETSSAVFNIPIDTYFGTYNIMPAYTGKPIVDGYFHWAAETDETKQFFYGPGQLHRFTCGTNDPIFSELTKPEVASAEAQLNTKAIEQLRAQNIRTIVVHKDGTYYHPHCQNVRTRVGTLIPLVKTVEPSVEQQVLNLKFENQKLSAFLFFPQAGTLVIDGLHAYPQKAQDLTLQLNGQILRPTWIDAAQDHLVYNSFDQTTQQPESSAIFEVKAGDVLELSASSLLEEGVLGMWLRYFADPNSLLRIKPKWQFEPIYDDSARTVYRLND